ncbi:aminotransferase class I/II-fold pyridoxal phosphate-dependent enzyme [Paenibacillus zeisoli]|uniref:Aminotransferase class I/II-fold pyridoxal phosphate-dependent enzyme n=1 Tax=Paenibacillus zeisoli TaxID=2496267 RepID=A0A433X0R9_9BACL|nr:aminotransferase class I/II-fold pyridoxal phosphate-dependent enzyme [Paenibacillus zeisoli]RUT27699.1 aminotransferase class I/II-fold pyridoxal phosphate-dependent enzyme [Paenibacillus zeisoli]
MSNRNDNIKAPLAEALLRYVERKDTSFHVPGHKNGRVFEQLTGGYKVLREIASIDATEIFGLDDLHHPEGVIAEAQEKAASFFGAEATYFLVAGSTAGNLALILSVCSSPGDVLLVQRNVHKSVIHGLMLAGANAVFLGPQADAASGLTTIPSAETVREALRRYPGAKGVLVTHPNYYGMGGSLAPLAELCHSSGIPLLVDEAHGAHFGLHPALPRSALSEGADGVVQSTHKMLFGLTMSAMLHVHGSLIDRQLLCQRLAMIQSSSPSYPLMASLDLTRGMLEGEGPSIFEEGLQCAAKLRREIRKLNRVGIVDIPPAVDGLDCSEMNGNLDGYTLQDPFKVVIYDQSGQISGYKLQERLEQAGCIPEMSDPKYVVLALSLGTSHDDIEKVLAVLVNLEEEMKGINSLNGQLQSRNPNSEALFGYRSTSDAEKNISFTSKKENEVLTASNQELSTWNIPTDLAISTVVPFCMTPISEALQEKVSIYQTEGRVAAEMVIPYPPGIPILYPGERITGEVSQLLIKLHQAGAKCQGTADSTMSSLKVYKNQKVGAEHGC